MFCVFSSANLKVKLNSFFIFPLVSRLCNSYVFIVCNTGDLDSADCNLIDTAFDTVLNFSCL